MIQKSINSEALAQYFGQATPALKQALFENRVDGRGSKDWDEGTGSNRFLKRG